MKKAVLFCRGDNELDLKVLHDYANSHKEYIVLPLLFTSEQDILNSDKIEYDVILTTNTIYLPIASIEIINVNA